MSDFVLLAAGVLALLAINGTYVAAEFALIAVRPARIRRRAAEGHTDAGHLWRLLSDLPALNRSLATTQLGITAASLGLGMWAEAALAQRVALPLVSAGWLSPEQAEAVSLGATLACLTYLHVVLGEMLPKSLALRYPETIGLGLARFVGLSERLGRPLVAAVNGCSNAIVRLAGIRPTGEQERTFHPEELALLIQESAQGGLLAVREREILLGGLHFAQQQVQSLMTPRAQVVGFPLDIRQETLEGVLLGSEHSRFPIYDGDLDHVVGILHLLDYVRWQRSATGALDLERLVRPTRLVPETLSAQSLLELFRRQSSHLAMVTDETGRTVGLVTLADVARCLVAARD